MEGVSLIETNDPTNSAWVGYPGNSAVTAFYLDIVANALGDAGYRVGKFPAGEYAQLRNSGVLRRDWLVVDTCTELIKAYLLGFRNIILWCQGIAPEESYMRNHDVLRRGLLSCIEHFALEKAKFVILVSNAMRQHYEQKYQIDLSGRCYIMPCFNSALREDAFENRDKYQSLRFAYVGSLAPWQCFDDTLLLYKEIEEQVENASLTIFTFEQEDAVARATALQIANFNVVSLPPDQLGAELKSMSYGFVIRDDIVVNQVSTPTKLSSYMSCGVIPIFSNCLRDFAEAASDLESVLPLCGRGEVSDIVEFVTKNVDIDRVEREYRLLFDTYYSEDAHRKRLAKLFSRWPDGRRKC